MRKFFDFVVQDDRPSITPPSEDEFGEQYAHSNEKTSNKEDDVVQTPSETGGIRDMTFKLSRIETDSNGNENSNDGRTRATTSQNEDDVQHISVSYSGETMEGPPKRGSSKKFHDVEDVLEHKGGVVSKDHGKDTPPVQNFDSEPQSEGSEESASHGILTPLPGTAHRRPRNSIAEEGNEALFEASSEEDKIEDNVVGNSAQFDRRLRASVEVLRDFSSSLAVGRGSLDENEVFSSSEIAMALRNIAEIMVWADQHDQNLWDTFLECSTMQSFLKCLSATVSFHETSSVPPDEHLDSNPSELPRLEREDDAPDFRLDGLHAKKVSLAEMLSKALTDRLQSMSKDGSFETKTVPENTSDSLTQSEQKHFSIHTDDNDEDSDMRDGRVAFMVLVQSQILQTVSILVQSVSQRHSLHCLFASNHINAIISFEYHFEKDEILGYFISCLKAIALKLDRELLQLFFDPFHDAFPLYTAVVRFFDHREQMVRIAVRNITLTVYALKDPEVLSFAARDDCMYLQNTVALLSKLCGDVARAFELIMDDGREMRRTRSRTGLFRRKVRVSEVSEKLEEIEDMLAYLGDIANVSKDPLRAFVVSLLTTNVFLPFFWPIASRASPASIRAQRKWQLARMTASPNATRAISLFDAAARCLLLAYLLRVSGSSRLGQVLVEVLRRSAAEFEGRSVLHALKSMAADISGTERVTFVSLCAIEAFVTCDSTTKDLISTTKYDFELEDMYTTPFTDQPPAFQPSIDNGVTVEQNQIEHHGQSMLMTLSDFEAPLTPSNSFPSTPTRIPTSPDRRSGSLPGFSRASSASSLHTASLSVDGLVPFEKSESDGILTSFQIGETSLREAISSILLVVRRREIRTSRVVLATCRIFNAMSAKLESTMQCAEISKVVADEIASSVMSFLNNKNTTIVSIERMFESFRAIASSRASAPIEFSTLDAILSPDKVPKTASEFPEGAGKRRRSLQDDATPPTEKEDAFVFFASLDMYERALGTQIRGDSFCGDVVKQVLELILEYNLDDSYLDKRDSLLDAAKVVINYGEEALQ